jgi:uncharacterized membrane protein YcaP (DUF421 family)
MQEYLGIVVRISIIYLYALAMLRLSGKRSLDSLSPMDFLVGLVLGDLFDDVIWAEIPIVQGMVAFTTIIALHILMAYLTYRSKAMHRLIESTRTEVVRMGEWVEAGLRKERTRQDEVIDQLRLQGEEKLDEIREAAWEPGGQLSVFKRRENMTAEKRDLDCLKELYG